MKAEKREARVLAHVAELVLAQFEGRYLLVSGPYFLVAWFALAAASTAYVAWDQYRNNPEPAVMKWGFILVTLYTDLLCAFFSISLIIVERVALCGALCTHVYEAHGVDSA